MGVVPTETARAATCPRLRVLVSSLVSVTTIIVADCVSVRAVDVWLQEVRAELGVWLVFPFQLMQVNGEPTQILSYVTPNQT